MGGEGGAHKCPHPGGLQSKWTPIFFTSHGPHHTRSPSSQCLAAKDFCDDIHEFPWVPLSPLRECLPTTPPAQHKMLLPGALADSPWGGAEILFVAQFCLLFEHGLVLHRPNYQPSGFPEGFPHHAVRYLQRLSTVHFVCYFRDGPEHTQVTILQPTGHVMSSE
jgi:hypothetical protein